MRFSKLFGIRKEHLKRTCLLVPYILPGLLKAFKAYKTGKGLLYTVYESPFMTIIKCGMGAIFTGDTVLHLKNSKCENAFFIGTCGLTKKNGSLNVGSIIEPEESLAIESFTRTLYPDKTEIPRFSPSFDIKASLGYADRKKINKVRCAAIGSLKLESERIDFYRDLGVQAVDMESSSFLSACEFVNIRSGILLVATDIIKEKPFYRKQSRADSLNISQAQLSAYEVLWNTAKEL